MHDLESLTVREFVCQTESIKLACQRFGSPRAPVILSLHGWQDNSASFITLAKAMPDYAFFVPDLAGHGRSQWRSTDASYSIWSYVREVMSVVAMLKNESVVLLGHSMGGALAILVAALYPQLIKKLILLDNLGAVTTPITNSLEQMRVALGQPLSFEMPKGRRRYSSLEAAIAARAHSGLSHASAALLAQRGVIEENGGWYWSIDPKLNTRSMMSFTEDHVREQLRALDCPVQLIAAPSFWEGEDNKERGENFRERRALVKNLDYHMLDGAHHQHMETQANLIASLIRDFLID
jgi:pimeloyl-ACP methyl ester carboxylesterase